MSPVTYFVLFLITIPDVEVHHHSVQRLVLATRKIVLRWHNNFDSLETQSWANLTV